MLGLWAVAGDRDAMVARCQNKSPVDVRQESEGVSNIWQGFWARKSFQEAQGREEAISKRFYRKRSEMEQEMERLLLDIQNNIPQIHEIKRQVQRIWFPQVVSSLHAVVDLRIPHSHTMDTLVEEVFGFDTARQQTEWYALPYLKRKIRGDFRLILDNPEKNLLNSAEVEEKIAQLDLHNRELKGLANTFEQIRHQLETSVVDFQQLVSRMEDAVNMMTLCTLGHGTGILSAKVLPISMYRELGDLLWASVYLVEMFQNCYALTPESQKSLCLDLKMWHKMIRKMVE